MKYTTATATKVKLDGFKDKESQFNDINVSIKKLTDGIGIAMKPMSTLGFSTPVIARDDYCLHKNCSACKSGLCSGVHFMSCPCTSCSPRMM